MRTACPLTSACLTSSLELWKEYKDKYRDFVEQFREAAKRLKERMFPVKFPEKCFWPSVGYVDSAVEPKPGFAEGLAAMLSFDPEAQGSVPVPVPSG